MPVYRYLTQTKRGSPFFQREIVAESYSQADKTLLSSQIAVLDLEERRHKKGIERLKEILGLNPTYPISAKLSFCQQMFSALKIDMPVLESLKLSREACIHKKFRMVLDGIIKRVEQGSTLYDALRVSGAFDNLFLGLVRSGEESGRLGDIFGYIKEIYYRAEIIRKKLYGMMIYPCIVILIAIGVIASLMYYAIPQFESVFLSFGVELPFPTRVLIGTSKFVVQNPQIVFLCLVGLAFFLFQIPKIYIKYPSSHEYILKLPVVGDIQKTLIQETFIRTFVNLLKGGLKYLDALSLCRTVSDNFVYRSAIAHAVVSVSLGNTLMVALDNYKDILGLLLIRAIGFGEKTGKIEEVLTPLGEILGFEINEKIDRLKTYVEPFLTIVIGSLVLFILLALFMPMFALPKVIFSK